MPITKEQVEAEGWKASQHFDRVFMRYDKEWCYGLWLLENNQIYISKSKPPKGGKNYNHTLYEGECKSIDKFREVCKSCNFGKSVDVNIRFVSSENLYITKQSNS